MIKLLLKTIANSAAIYIASNIIDGFTFSGNLLILAGIGATLTVLRLLIYPVIKIIAFPVAFLSFGLFGTLLNLAALSGLAYLSPDLSISGIMPLILATVVLSLVNLLFSWL